MAERKFQKGTALIKEAAERKSTSRRFTPNIFWRAGDVKTIAFLTPADEIPKVLLHQMVPIPDDRFDSGVRYENIVCKKDPSMVEEFGGACELCDTLKHQPAERFVALAVELDPVKDGKKVTALRVKTNRGKNKDGVEQDYPQWGIVIQAAKNFFSYFGAYGDNGGDIREVAWEIQREGASTDTKYHPFIVMNGPNAVPLPDLSKIVDDIPTLDDLLENMASDAKYAEAETVPPSSIKQFGGSNKKPAATDDGATSGGERQADFAKIRDEVAAY